VTIASSTSRSATGRATAPGRDQSQSGNGSWIREIADTYVADFVALLDRTDRTEIEAVVEQLRRTRDAGGTIFIAGNGGSAATATHWVNDLAKATIRSGRTRIRAICLTDSTSWLTALANDEGFERVFVGQLENLARPGDVLAVISASGNSPNLVTAVQYAAANGVTTIGLLGFDGGKLRRMVDLPVFLPTEHGAYGLVETGHSLVADIVTACLIDDCPADGE
jgi:D-sedoheptulose 7-phosphate isomerase